MFTTSGDEQNEDLFLSELRMKYRVDDTPEEVCEPN